MNLTLKERHKLLGKFGATFLIIYHLILIVNVTSIYNFMFKFNVANVLSLVFFLLLIFNICTLWKLNKLSFWSTIISIVALTFAYIEQINYSLNYIADYNKYLYYTGFSYSYYILFVVFLGLLVAFLLMFLIFIIKKREAFGIKFEFNKNIDTNVDTDTDTDETTELTT